MKTVLLILLICVVQTVYANPYTENYEIIDNYEEIESNKNSKFLSVNDKPRVQYIDGIEQYYDYLSEGYVAIGTSNFVSNSAYDRQALEQAKKVKATLVLINRVLLDQSLNVVDASKKTSTQFFYNFDATFMVMDDSYKQGSLGISFKELPQEIVTKYQRNTGVLVILVYKNGPAYRSNLLRNDVITQINGREIWKENFLTVLNEEKSKSSKVTFTILRDSSSIKIPVALGAW